MENKSTCGKNLKKLIQEVAPEPILKAPPPTPCISLKQRSGSVPDVRTVEVKKEKSLTGGFHCRGLIQTLYSTHKVTPKFLSDFGRKRSTSDHGMASECARGGLWMAFAKTPCTSNLLHSVRQRLMNL